MAAYRQHTGVPGMGGEVVTVAAPRRWRAEGRLALVLAEGYTNDAEVTFRPAQLQPVVEAVTAAGFLVVNAQLGTNAFGNDLAQQRIDGLVEFARSAYGADPERVALAGFSMGAMNVLSWAGNAPVGEVACVHVWCPATDQAWMHGLAQWAPALDAAYDGWTSADLAGHDPLTMAQAGLYDGIPLRVEYAADDATIPAARVQAFAAAAGVTAHNLGAGGHEYIQTRKPASVAALVDALRTADE